MKFFLKRLIPLPASSCNASSLNRSFLLSNNPFTSHYPDLPPHHLLHNPPTQPCVGIRPSTHLLPNLAPIPPRYVELPARCFLYFSLRGCSSCLGRQCCEMNFLLRCCSGDRPILEELVDDVGAMSMCRGENELLMDGYGVRGARCGRGSKSDGGVEV